MFEPPAGVPRMRGIARRSIREEALDHEHTCIASLACVRLFDRVVMRLSQWAQVMQGISTTSTTREDMVHCIGRLPAPRHDACVQVAPQRLGSQALPML